MKLKFWNNDKELLVLADTMDIIIDTINNNPKFPNVAKPEKHIPYNEQDAKNGRPWRTDKDGKTKYHFKEI